MQDDETKVCPYCAEAIKAAAIKCKHCGSDLSEQQTAPVQEQPQDTTTPPSPSVPPSSQVFSQESQPPAHAEKKSNRMLKIGCLGTLILLGILILPFISFGVPTFGIILNLAGVALAISFLANAKFRGKIGGILKLNPEKKTGSIFAGVLIPVFLFCLLLSFVGLSVEKDAKKQAAKGKQAKIEQENMSKFENAVKRGDQAISVGDFTGAKSAFAEALEIKGYKGKKDKAHRGLLVSQLNLDEEGVAYNYLESTEFPRYFRSMQTVERPQF